MTTDLLPATTSPNTPPAPQPAQRIEVSGAGFGTERSFALIQRAAMLLSKSSLVPKEYQGDTGMPNCVIALNMAQRIGADPLMVMQNLYVVHGRPAWSAQFLIATFNQSGRFSALRYAWTGKPGDDSWGCQAWAIELATGEKLEGCTITVKMSKDEGWYTKNGSKWKTMPQQMLMYRAASWFVRAYAPEIAMGLHTADEVEDDPAGFNGCDAESPKAGGKKQPKASKLNEPATKGDAWEEPGQAKGEQKTLVQ